VGKKTLPLPLYTKLLINVIRSLTFIQRALLFLYV
jgi:hypothetical protein